MARLAIYRCLACDDYEIREMETEGSLQLHAIAICTGEAEKIPPMSIPHRCNSRIIGIADFCAMVDDDRIDHLTESWAITLMKSARRRR